MLEASRPRPAPFARESHTDHHETIVATVEAGFGLCVSDSLLGACRKSYLMLAVAVRNKAHRAESGMISRPTRNDIVML
jgi:hypothetical protein